MVDLRTVYKPSRWGEVYHSLPYDEVLGAGSAGPGKSMVLLMEPFQQIALEHARCAERDHKHRMSWGDSSGWALHLRRTGTRLEQSIVRSHRIFPQIDSKARFDATKKTWIFSSGYRYQFGHCKDPDDWTQYLSFEYSLIMFDELVEFDEEQYDQIITRLRSSDPCLSKMLKVRSMSNPVMTQGADSVTTKDPHWVRKRFVEPAREGKVVLKRELKRANGEHVRWYTWMYWPATLYDNPDPEFVKNYEQRLLAAKPHIRQALLYGDWFVTAASFFADVWNQQIHVVKPFKVPGDWRVFRSMDWGFKQPGCVHWWALDGDGQLWCVRELTFQGKTPAQVAEMVKEIEERMGVWSGRRSGIPGVADTQLWERRGDDVKAKAEVFAEMGVPWMPADKKSRRRNAELLYERLAAHQKGTAAPGIAFFETCRKVTQLIPAVQTDQRDIELPVDGGDDHWIDSAFYACAYASRTGVGVSRDEADEREERAERSGRWDDGADDRGMSGYGAY